jgi:hypothetical protein
MPCETSYESAVNNCGNGGMLFSATSRNAESDSQDVRTMLTLANAWYICIRPAMLQLWFGRGVQAITIHALGMLSPR